MQPALGGTAGRVIGIAKAVGNYPTLFVDPIGGHDNIAKDEVAVGYRTIVESPIRNPLNQVQHFVSEVPNRSAEERRKGGRCRRRRIPIAPQQRGQFSQRVAGERLELAGRAAESNGSLRVKDIE